MNGQQRQAFEHFIKTTKNPFKPKDQWIEYYNQAWVGFDAGWQAALAQREPVADGEVAAMVKALRRDIPADYPIEPIELKAALVLERTEAARLAAIAEIKRCTKEYDALSDQLINAEEERDALRAQLASSQQDAERLEWLANHHGWLECRFVGQKKATWSCRSPFTNYPYAVWGSLREAIDAAKQDPKR